jgi:hypothetical protein
LSPIPAAAFALHSLLYRIRPHIEVFAADVVRPVTLPARFQPALQ